MLNALPRPRRTPVSSQRSAWVACRRSRHLLARYAQPLTRATFAAELGLSSDAAELNPLEARASPAAKAVLTRLRLGPVPRADVEPVLPELFALLAGQSPAPSPSVTGPAANGMRAADTVEEIDLVLETDKARYATGELLSLRARVNRTCNLTVLTIDPRGRATVIFPNDFDQSNTLEAGKTLRLPMEAAPFQLRLGQKGRETIVGICSSTQKTVDGIRHDFEKQRFTALGDYRAFLLRNWANGSDTGEAKPPRARGRAARGSQDKAAERAPVRADQQGRAAIQIEVE